MKKDKKPINVIVELTKETVDFAEFVQSVLEWEDTDKNEPFRIL